MAEFSEELRQIAAKFDELDSKAAGPGVRESIEAFKDALSRATDAFCDSWLGHQSRIYYDNFSRPPAGVRFDPTSSLDDDFGSGTRGKWREYSKDDVEALLNRSNPSHSVEQLIALARSIIHVLTDLREEIISALVALTEEVQDPYLLHMLDEARL